MEELLIDNYYYFEKSSKRKSELAEFCSFCNQEYRKLLKHISVRWLSLEKCIEQFPSLKSYFLSQGLILVL